MPMVHAVGEATEVRGRKLEGIKFRRCGGGGPKRMVRSLGGASVRRPNQCHYWSGSGYAHRGSNTDLLCEWWVLLSRDGIDGGSHWCDGWRRHREAILFPLLREAEFGRPHAAVADASAGVIDSSCSNQNDE